MAIKDKSKEEKIRGKLATILVTEYKWENYILLVLALISLVFSLLLHTGELVPNSDFPLIGTYPKIFAWALTVLSVFGLILVFYPFAKNSFPEIKKITWAKFPEFVDNMIRVFIFILFFSLFFFAADAFIRLFKVL